MTGNEKPQAGKRSAVIISATAEPYSLGLSAVGGMSLKIASHLPANAANLVTKPAARKSKNPNHEEICLSLAF